MPGGAFQHLQIEWKYSEQSYLFTCVCPLRWRGSRCYPGESPASCGGHWLQGWGLGWGRGAGSAGLLQLLLLDTKQALPSSCLFCCGQTQHPSMLSLINIPCASKPSAFFQLSPPPRAVGSSSSKCQTLAVPPLLLSLLGSLGCEASSKGYSCKEGSDKCKSCSSISIRNRPASQKPPKKLLYINEVLFKTKKIENWLYREQLV